MNPVQWLQETQRIHGICPCCDALFRLSDATVYIAKRPPKTPFDKHYDALRRFENVANRFQAERDVVLEKERQRGLAAAEADLKKISPVFLGRDIEPRDVKVLFDPVRYVVFRGMTAADMTGIELVDDEPTTTAREKVVRSIDDVIKKGNIDWATWRVTEEGTVVLEDRG